MNTLASLLSWMISQLQGWPAASNIQTLESEAFADDQFQFKVRADLQTSFKLQVRFYYNRGHVDYAYQLFRDTPVLRWDNKEDAGQLATAPHHFHDENDDISESPLIGEPAHDWPMVKAAIESHFGDREEPSRFDFVEL